MSEVTEILAEIDELRYRKIGGVIGKSGSSVALSDSADLLEKVQALLTSHAVIDKEAAEDACCVLGTEGFDESARKCNLEVDRLELSEPPK